MGVQSSERVTGNLYDRRVKNQTIADIANIYHRLGVKPHFQLIFDDPVSTDEDKQKLFEMIATFPHPYDLYLFSMTVFPGSELNHKLIQSGLISRYDIEGDNTKTFNQHRINITSSAHQCRIFITISSYQISSTTSVSQQHHINPISHHFSMLCQLYNFSITSV